MRSEDERVECLRARYATRRLGVRVGIGDDAAVLDAEPTSTVLSVDVMVDGIHFRSAWRERGMSFSALGYRAAVAALSDLAAMGAMPRAILSSLILPEAITDELLDALSAGIAEAAEAYGAPVVGGNLSRGSELSITTTVVGAAEGPLLTRRGARPGDGLYVTGSLGAAALGWRALDAAVSHEPLATAFVARWLRPSAHVAAGARLAETATAAMDVSDGLLLDLSRLCHASEVGADIELAQIPIEDGHAALASRLGVDATEAILAGGDDYVILFASPAAEVAAEIATRIGHVTDRAGVVRALDASGGEIALATRGHTHF